MLTKHRVLTTDPAGYVEFLDPAAAEAWRDANAPGAQIITITEDPPAEPEPA